MSTVAIFESVIHSDTNKIGLAYLQTLCNQCDGGDNNNRFFGPRLPRSGGPDFIVGPIAQAFLSTGWYNWYWVYKLLLGFWDKEREPVTEIRTSVLQSAFETGLAAIRKHVRKRQEWLSKTTAWNKT